MLLPYQTSRFGTIDVPEEEIINFPEGILGFSGMRRFCLIDIDNQRPFMWLQSLENPALAFVCVDPALFFPDYRIPVKAIELAGAEIENPEDAVVYVFLVVPSDPAKITANLQGPVVINRMTRVAKQLVLMDTPYTTRHFIFSQEAADAGAQSKAK